MTSSHYIEYSLMDMSRTSSWGPHTYYTKYHVEQYSKQESGSHQESKTQFTITTDQPTSMPQVMTVAEQPIEIPTLPLISTSETQHETPSSSRAEETLPTIEPPPVGPRPELPVPSTWTEWAHQMIYDLRTAEEKIREMHIPVICPNPIHKLEEASGNAHMAVTTMVRGLKRWERELLIIERLGFRRALSLRGEDSHTVRMAINLELGISEADLDEGKA
jgi:hypothetical protein